MSNIFLFSNSYMGRTILYNLDYTLGLSLEKILLLHENYKQHECFYHFQEKQIVLCEHIEECILNSDITIVISDNNLPMKNVNIAKNMSESMGKRCIIVDGANSNIQSPKKIKNISKFIGRPLVLIISSGEYTQNYCTEIMLNRLFAKYGVDIYQGFSEMSNNIFQKLNANEMINPTILESQKRLPQEANIIVQTIITENIFENSKVNAEIAYKIYLMKPDYILLNVNAGVVITDIVKDIFYNKYGHKINAIVKSSYVPVVARGKKPVALYIDMFDDFEGVISAEDDLAQNTLVMDIFSKVALPKYVSLIK